MLVNFATFCIFYTISALLYYFNHRFLYHSRPRGPRLVQVLWRKWTQYHMDHHRHWKQNDPKTRNYIKIPLWGKFMGIGIIICLGMTINIGAGTGVLLFFTLYGIRHGAIHGFRPAKIFKPLPRKSMLYKHHMSHHTAGGVKFNFSGVHPFIDNIFGTYKNPNRIIFKKRRKR